MALELTVEAGQVFTDGGLITATELNNAANPTVEIEDGTITSEQLDLDEVVAAISPSLSGANALVWGSFQEDRFSISGTVSAADGVRQPVHPGWYVLADGAAVNVAAAARSSSSESNEAGRCGVKVFGDSSLTAVSVGTYAPPGLAQLLYSGNMTFSCYIYNGTGTTFTPSLELYAGATAGDEGSVSLVATVSADGSCAAGQWTRVQFDFDASAVTNFAKGCHFRVKVTKASGIMDSGSDYFILADAQMDPGVTEATALKRGVLPPYETPPGALLGWAGAYNAVPPGWLFCDGSAVSRARYAGLFANVGTSYGVGDGSTTFNLPDGRGRTLVGAEIAGSSQGRTEVAVSVVSSASDTLTVASGATAPLRLGMGAYNGGVLTGQTIVGLTPTTIQLSASVGTGISGTVYFSKLGAGNAQTLGATGAGLSGKRNVVSFTVKNCSISGTTVTLPGSYFMLKLLAQGMTISGTGVTSGTTVAGFLTSTTLKMSASGTTGSGLDLTFSVFDAEGQAWERYAYLRANPIVQFTVNTAADSQLEDVPDNDWSDIVFVGMGVTCSDSAAGVQANTYVTGFLNRDVLISPATSGATSASYLFQFTSGGLTRETTAQAAPGPGLMTANFIIKT